jgi:hypothetical protein
LFARITLLVGVVEYVDVGLINASTGEDIADEFRKRRLSDTDLSEKEDGVWCIRRIVRGLDDSLLERLYITRKYG